MHPTLSTAILHTQNIHCNTFTYWMECTYLEGTPLVDLVEHLGIEGTLDEVAPFSEGWGASVELIGSVISPTLLPLSIGAGVVTLAIGVTGDIEFLFNWLKESKEHELVFSFKVPWLCFQPAA